MACKVAACKGAVKPHVQAIKARTDNGSVFMELQEVISQSMFFDENSI